MDDPILGDGSQDDGVDLDTPEDVKRGEGTGCWSRDGMERLAPRVAIGLVEDLVFILPPAPAPAPPTPTGP